MNKCNEFVSIKDAEVASAFFFCDKNSLEDFFRCNKDDYNMSSFRWKRYNALEQAKKSANYKKSKFDDNMFYKNYYQNFRNLLNCQKQLGLPYIPILYKNDKLGFRLENMKLSVFAKKINDGFKMNKLEPLFGKDEIQELEKFENQFVFEGINDYTEVEVSNNNNTEINLSNTQTGNRRHRSGEKITCCNII